MSTRGLLEFTKGLRAAMPEGVVVERWREPMPHFLLAGPDRSVRVLCEHSVAIRDGLSGIWYTPSEALRPRSMAMVLASALLEIDPGFADAVIVWLPHGLASADFFEDGILLGDVEAISARLSRLLGL